MEDGDGSYDFRQISEWSEDDVVCWMRGKYRLLLSSKVVDKCNSCFDLSDVYCMYVLSNMGSYVYLQL